MSLVCVIVALMHYFLLIIFLVLNHKCKRLITKGRVSFHLLFRWRKQLRYSTGQRKLSNIFSFKIIHSNKNKACTGSGHVQLHACL